LSSTFCMLIAFAKGSAGLAASSRCGCAGHAAPRQPATRTADANPKRDCVARLQGLLIQGLLIQVFLIQVFLIQGLCTQGSLITVLHLTDAMSLVYLVASRLNTPPSVRSFVPGRLE
jgi:hypothetical protein